MKPNKFVKYKGEGEKRKPRIPYWYWKTIDTEEVREERRDGLTRQLLCHSGVMQSRTRDNLSYVVG